MSENELIEEQSNISSQTIVNHTKYISQCRLAIVGVVLATCYFLWCCGSFALIIFAAIQGPDNE